MARDPFRGRMWRNIDPDKISAGQSDDDEDIEQVKANGRDNEEVHRRDVRRMVTQEGAADLVSRRQVHHYRVSKRLRDRASELHGSMGHRDRRCRQANLLCPYALLEPVHARTEDGIESDHRAD